MPDKVAVSEKPWSEYTEADYTIEQYHAACLIHQHEGAPTSKNQCKLPVKTPNGTLNRAGVHAAAAALAGARGGVSASESEKAAAAKALARYYKQLDEEPPESLKHSFVDNFLAHATVSIGGGGGKRKFSENMVKRNAGGQFSTQAATGGKPKDDKTWMAGLEGLQDKFFGKYESILNEIEDKFLKKYGKTKGNSPVLELPAKRDAEMRKQQVEALNEKMKTDSEAHSPSGTQRVNFHRTSDGHIRARVIPHTKANSKPEKLKHMASLENFLAHYGVRGMKWGVRRSSSGGGNAGGTKTGKNADTDGDGKPDTRISADAERFVKTHQKQSHEMSTREIREATERARLVKQYDDMFNPGPNSALQTKVQELQLKKQYNDLQAELNPSAVQRVSSMVKSAESAYDSYSKLDRATGGELSKAIGQGLGLTSKHQPKHRKP